MMCRFREHQPEYHGMNYPANRDRPESQYPSGISTNWGPSIVSSANKRQPRRSIVTHKAFHGTENRYSIMYTVLCTLFHDRRETPCLFLQPKHVHTLRR